MGDLIELRGTRQHGRYAHRVRVQAPQGSSFDGLVGIVVRTAADTVFVRLQNGITLPFAQSELEVLS